MQRHAFAIEVKEGKTAEFRSNLGKIWKELVSFLDEKKMVNFSMWNVERMVFGYYESEDDFTFTDADKEKAAVWEETYGSAYTWISTPFEEMRLMYHDFGIVRECKELIRHRVFITKLVPGTEEEYKARHDALVEARGNEIDTTMERDRTEEDRQGDIAWETKMLEIMSWLTDDVDWITGQCHENIRRICWHN